jgi:GNAT superfamily N-acetyltransferase
MSNSDKFIIKEENPSPELKDERKGLREEISRLQGIDVNSYHPATHHLTARHTGTNQLIGLGEISLTAQNGSISLMVHPEWQRQGIGTELVGRILEIGEQTGLRELRATVDPWSGAEKLLRRNNFFAYDPNPVLYKKTLTQVRFMKRRI